MTREEVKEQIQIDLCTLMECMGLEDNRILDAMCQIVVDNFKKLDEEKS